MFTVLIASLKTGYLQSQLHWLSKQNFRQFFVIVMDANYKANRHQFWLQKKYPFKLEHIPLIHNINTPKRYDLSIKNNLALLAPTNHFIFLSDTHYFTPEFSERIADHIFSDKGYLAFAPIHVMASAYDAFNHRVDIGGEAYGEAKHPFLFDRKFFFYVLNGFDEATTYGFQEHEAIGTRIGNAKVDITGYCDIVYHMIHSPTDNEGPWTQPCEKCRNLFAEWKFKRTLEEGTFAYGSDDPELVDQFTTVDPETGLMVFECPNCGFGGVLNPRKYLDMLGGHKWVAAPSGLLEGRLGRNLGQVYETMVKKVSFGIEAKMAFLKTTY